MHHMPVVPEILRIIGPRAPNRIVLLSALQLVATMEVDSAFGFFDILPIKKIFIIFLAAVCLFGCNVRSEKEVKEIKDTILRYNHLLAEGYSKMNITPLKEVATEEHALKVYHHMAALGEAKIRMESQLLDIEFSDIQFPKKDFVRVKTREKWNYTHINIGSKMPGQTVVQSLIYKLSYELVKKDSRWFVSSISVLEENKPENVSKNDRPHSDRR
jgi:hypothetical protein